MTKAYPDINCQVIMVVNEVVGLGGASDTARLRCVVRRPCLTRHWLTTDFTFDEFEETKHTVVSVMTLSSGIVHVVVFGVIIVGTRRTRWKWHNR